MARFRRRSLYHRPHPEDRCGEDAQVNTKTFYKLADNVSIRPERFGALVYNYDNRRLCFVHSHLVADFVAGLDGARPLAEMVEAFMAGRGLADAAGASVLRAVSQLEQMGVVRAVR
ncbi:MAG: mycofactocin biosynthesis chaperone MftB [Rhodospirillales bacterium]|nr:MAG: mycofactocin biosynthesis chaperone MftB [Rhodospirillales bacterium]